MMFFQQVAKHFHTHSPHVISYLGIGFSPKNRTDGRYWLFLVIRNVDCFRNPPPTPVNRYVKKHLCPPLCPAFKRIGCSLFEGVF